MSEQSAYALIGGQKYSEQMFEAAVEAYRKALKARVTCVVLDVKESDDVHVVIRDAAFSELKSRERYVMGAARMERAEHIREIDARLAKEKNGKSK